MFKDISEAYSVLSDATKRKQYDVGGDMEDGSVGFAGGPGFDPNVIFKTFFGEDMNGMGGVFGGFPASSFFTTTSSGDTPFGSSGGFPGGMKFSFSQKKR